MDDRFIMGNNDPLIRHKAPGMRQTEMNASLSADLIRLAIIEALSFYSGFFHVEPDTAEIDNFTKRYAAHQEDATKLKLFRSGGARQKDHLNFWCLSHVFKPAIYIESGVYLGSSLHAFIDNPQLKKTIAIDPGISKLRVPVSRIPGACLIDDLDFSQLAMSFFGEHCIAYFDDHINTAERILQAHQKGIRYVLFDDSTGFEGICQRLFPAIPTLPMIIHHDSLAPGGKISWTYSRPYPSSLAGFLKHKLFKRGRQNQRISLTISDEIKRQCSEARDVIKRWTKIPDLGTFLPQPVPERQVDTSKYLLELK